MTHSLPGWGLSAVRTHVCVCDLPQPYMGLEPERREARPSRNLRMDKQKLGKIISVSHGTLMRCAKPWLLS